MNKFKFLCESIKNLKIVGIVMFSLCFLCEVMLKGIDFFEVMLIVELGGGNGVLMQYILKKMCLDVCLFIFEVQVNFCELFCKIDDDCLVVIEDFVEFLFKYLVEYGCKDVDYIILVIFFVILLKFLVKSIIFICCDYLVFDGCFV